MAGTGSELSAEALKAGANPVLEEFLGQGEEYTAVAAAALEDIKNGRNEALFVPAVKLIVDATLSVMAQEQVQATITAEVAARRRTAVHYGEVLTRVFVQNGVFQQFYDENRDLALFAGLAAPYVNDLEDFDALGRLGLAPFHDISVVSGGAVGYMKEHDISGDRPADIIKRSRNLLAISGVSLERSKQLFTFLGTPYASATHYELADEGPEPKLSFTEDTLAFIKRLGGKGCPTGHMATARDASLTVLEDTSRRMIDYLVPANATADEPATPGCW